jgi:putative serine protease PepD
MAEEDRPGDYDRGDYRYFGPFGAPPGPPTGPGRAQGPVGQNESDPTAPLEIGHWTYADEELTAQLPPVEDAAPAATTRLLPAQSGPTFESSGSQAFTNAPNPYSPPPPPARDWDGSLFPAPAGVVPLRPQPPDAVAPIPYPTKRRRKPLRGAAVILLAALTALVIGGAAGYGGSRLAARTAPLPQTSTAPVSPSSAPSAPFTPAPGQANTVGVAKAVLPSTVMIQVGSGTDRATGSGFVLDTRGRIMTNNHVVAAAGGGTITVVFADGTRTTAELVGRSPSYDLAVIKVDPSSHLTPIRIGDSDASQIGESVIAIGSPLGLPGTVTAGIVSAKNRPVVVNGSGNADAPTAYINAIQTDAPINPGNSGGPLVDPQARVIGVNSAILTLGETQGQSGSIGLGFAIPINQAMEIGNLLIKKGKATYPVIGANVSNEDPEAGVRLTSVESGGPAAAAGLKQGDVITTINGHPVTNISSLIVNIRTHRPGEHIDLGYQRNGAKADAVVTLGSKEG